MRSGSNQTITGTKKYISVWNWCGGEVVVLRIGVDALLKFGDPYTVFLVFFLDGLRHFSALRTCMCVLPFFIYLIAH